MINSPSFTLKWLNHFEFLRISLLIVGVGGMILILGGISRNCPRVFYFKDYNAAIHISGKKRKFKRLWWLAPQKTRNETFLEN